MKIALERGLIIVPLVLILSMTGCRKYYEFLPTEVPQSKIDKKDNGDEMRSHVKAAYFYDQFATLARFEVLKCSDEVVMIAERERALLEGDSEEKAHLRMCDALRENQRELVFYVWAYVVEDLDVPLGSDKSPWRFWLNLSDGSRLKPSHINETMWTSELYSFFGREHHNYKQLLKIIFPLSGAGDDLAEGTLRSGPIEFVMRTTGHQKMIRWPAENGWTKKACEGVI